MTIATRADLLVCRPRIREVELDGITFRVRGLSLAARNRINAEEFVLDDKGRAQVRDGNKAAQLMLQQCLIDDQDQPLFAYDELDLIGSLVPSLLDKLITVVRELSGLDEEAAKALGKDSGSTTAAIT